MLFSKTRIARTIFCRSYQFFMHSTMVVRQTSEITSLYRQATGFPAPSSGQLVFTNDAIVTVNSSWSQRDIERKEKITLHRSQVIDFKTGDVLSETGPQEVNNELWNKTSPSGNFRAVVRSGKDKKDEDKQFLEIYDKTKKLKTVDILALEKHGKIINDDGQFGSFEWSSSEGHLLYVAEKKKQKSSSFFDTKGFKSLTEETNEDLKDETKMGNEFLYTESWGEQLTERHHPVLCVIDVETGVVSLLENVDDSLSPGQAMWTPDDAGIVFCAWDHEPYRLGLKHCCQRKSGLYHLDIQKGSVELLSEEGRAVRYPRFSPNMSRLIYFDTPVGGAHLQCARLVVIDWATGSKRIVVDIVRNAPPTSFQGIFIAALPRNIWFEDNEHIALSTAWRSTSKVVIINTDSGTITPLSIDQRCSYSLLCVEKSSLLLSASSLSVPFHLVVVNLQEIGNPDSARLFHPDGTPENLECMSSWELLQHKPTSDRFSKLNPDLDYESILCLPSMKDTDKNLPPLIVFSHGGPHVGFDTSYNVITNFFCLCGYAVVMVNYRGSWGFGQDGVDSLLGNVGDMDVKDVEAAMVSVVMKGVVDANKILVCGGSHGGFLTTHLIGQYPKTFKAACSRNPVTNLTSMWSTTDIPDWIFAEGGFPFDMASLMEEDKFPELWKRSPMSYVDNVKTPMLLLVGLQDRRVPPTQSKEYFKALKARKIPVKCLTYPSSNHSLAEVDVEGDCMVNTVVWFNAHI